jgi:hypothetical protein
MTSGLQRVIGLFALVTLMALGMGFVLEKARIGPPERGVPAASQPAGSGDPAKPGTPDQDYDRSDIVLSLG